MLTPTSMDGSSPERKTGQACENALTMVISPMLTPTSELDSATDALPSGHTGAAVEQALLPAGLSTSAEPTGDSEAAPRSLFQRSGQNFGHNSLSNFESQEEFSYRPVPVLVPVSLGMTFLSLIAFLSDILVAVPLLGVIFAAIAVWQIRKSAGSYGGFGLALTGLVCCLMIFTGAASLHAYSFATEVPDGFRRVNFASDISAKGFIEENGEGRLHPEVAKLANQSLFLKGYMYPTRQQFGLRQFILCKDSGDCCFGGQPKPTDMMVIEMQDGLTANFSDGLVSVAGTFVAEPTVDSTGLKAIYKIKCKYFSRAKSSY